ncbi:probable disease resistance protein At4g33300 [Cryptomeria japonica]|uniref:probable disease resistance protein At4g33300 n=1 Tax=Cryptomeria japonica TaxID=3369 RepID=UPI0027DA8AE6|nr:probable disease resistance protein At4g33300 [Cryptomeria japonica]
MALINFIGSSEMADDSAYVVPGKSQFYVGLNKSIGDLRELLFKSDVSVVGLQCMGGGGKTTLALALLNDPQIKGYFRGNVIFITVSQAPNLKGILEILCEKMAGNKRPEFLNLKDGQMKVQQLILSQSKPTLVILDDVWSKTNLENLLFEGPGYKTLVTTRDNSTIPTTSTTELYQLPLLCPDDALSLFCFWAFGQPSIPSTVNANIVMEVQAQCGGLPLAIKVIGSSLHGEPHEVWERAKDKICKGESISDYHKNGLIRLLEISIDSLDDVAKECFLDIALFPDDRKICADALLDIWVYVRKLQWHDAFSILSDLASRNLLNLSSTPRRRVAISHGNASELYFSLHSVMRELALHLGCRDDIVQRKRFLMDRKEHSLPEKWELLNHNACDVQVLSINSNTDPMEANHWFEVNLPDTEALLLFFSSSEYFLPPFLKSMMNLKFVMVLNYGTKRATVKGLDVLSSLTQLKSVRLERLTATPVRKQSNEPSNLEKVSLSLCEGFEYSFTFNRIKLRDFNIDHSSNLEEVPLSFCYMPSIKMWSISNCHLVQKLPYNLGNMSSLRMLMLSALPGVKELPPSIGNLRLLECLDISLCEGLIGLPEEIGLLKKLSEFDMTECSRLKRLPRAVCDLSSLKLVICDEKIGKQWLRAKNISIPELTVKIVEPQFSLDWLDD